MRTILSVLLAGFVTISCQEPSAPEAVNSTPAAPEVQVPATDSIEYALAGSWRSDDAKARDVFRNPAATLEFCEVDPSGNISEIWPGGGWYSQVLVPWVHGNGGQFTAAIIDPTSSERAAALLTRYMGQFSDASIFGTVSHGAFGATSELFTEPASQDAVLTFRNVHSWMARDMAQKAFSDFYAALKPGGVLCITEHRLPSSAVQEPKAPTGYVQEAMTKALATEAGFVFEAASEINANPKDTADHPFGVWTLPPVKASPRNDEQKAEHPNFDRAKYDAIGESDRMTLRFRKPAP